MHGKRNEEEVPPDSTDYAGWRQAIEDGRFRQFPMEAVVAAFQDLRPNYDNSVRNALAKHISDVIYRLLRRNVGFNHPNQGRDIIDRVHYQMFEALGTPNSADGKGLRTAFASRLHFRLKDAIAKEAQERRTPDQIPQKSGKNGQSNKEVESEDGRDEVDEGGSAGEASEQEGDDAEDADSDQPVRLKNRPSSELLDDVRKLDEQIDVDRFLEENIADDKKRLFGTRAHALYPMSGSIQV
jgi:hypothetical protein